MSRSGYSDDCDGYELILWRGAVASAIRGKRGQQLLRELAEAMDAMPAKELIAHDLQRDGAYCALGVVGAKRGVNMAHLDPDNSEALAKTFNIAGALVKEIEFENDEFDYSETPAARWTRMRQWVSDQLQSDGPSPASSE